LEVHFIFFYIFKFAIKISQCIIIVFLKPLKAEVDSDEDERDSSVDDTEDEQDISSVDGTEDEQDISSIDETEENDEQDISNVELEDEQDISNVELEDEQDISNDDDGEDEFDKHELSNVQPSTSKGQSSSIKISSSSQSQKLPAPRSSQLISTQIQTINFELLTISPFQNQPPNSQPSRLTSAQTHITPNVLRPVTNNIKIKIRKSSTRKSKRLSDKKF
jgi:hypothetical protein